MHVPCFYRVEVWEYETVENTVMTKGKQLINFGCVPLGGSGSGLMIQDHSDHGVPKERSFGS